MRKYIFIIFDSLLCAELTVFFELQINQKGYENQEKSYKNGQKVYKSGHLSYKSGHLRYKSVHFVYKAVKLSFVQAIRYMIKTTKILLRELSKYKNPQSKIARLVKDGVYIPIIKGLYETNRDTPAHFLAASIYAPSYVSFEYALAYYSLIPETVYACTCATFEKKRTKKYETPFGLFMFRDVPSAVYPYGVDVYKEGEYAYQIASAEKAVCDQLYKISKIYSQKELERVLFEDLRIDEGEFNKLNYADMIELSGKYGSVNLEILGAYLKRRYKNG